MKEVPEEYKPTVEKASNELATIAKLVMFVAQMLDNDTFELDTRDGWNVKITKSE